MTTHLLPPKLLFFLGAAAEVVVLYCFMYFVACCFAICRQ